MSTEHGVPATTTMRPLNRGKAIPGGHLPYHYDIHGLTTVASAVWLPELATFQSAEPIAEPNISVRIGKLPPMGGTAQSKRAGRSIRYAEGLGRVGFGADVQIHELNRIDILATPILKYSPHVLYTNLVEPILRWNFVEKGVTLVHGACIAYGDRAYMVTAKTDTGKTTTILRLLDEAVASNQNIAFISDDLTLVAPDGQVMSYPKPLTISNHTVAAVNTPMLTARERFFLPLQSRLHSRSGRRWALFLAKSRLPMATINTYVQLLVPPPKYHVDRLIPNVKVAQKATLAGLFVIERNGKGHVILGRQEAMEILLSNCDDAYGFPPYGALEAFLRTPSGQTDLRATERAIVTEAFQNLPATLLRSERLDWAQRIPAFINNAAPIPVT